MIRSIRRFFGLESSPPSKFIPTKPVPVAFSTYAREAITLIINSNGQLEDPQILLLFEENGIPADEAIELLLFLPIAFCRHLLTQVNWPDYYVEYTAQNKPIKLLYSNNQRYMLIQAALSDYLAGGFYQSDYLKIAGRSASFHSLNQLLLNNPGAKLAELIVTAEHLIR